MEKIVMNCVLFGRSKVGKSTLINNLVARKVAMDANEIQDTLMRTTIEDSSHQIIYKDKPIILFDTPGIFDQLTNNLLSSSKHIELLIRK